MSHQYSALHIFNMDISLLPQYGDFSHHYVFTFIIYACIFYFGGGLQKSRQQMQKPGKKTIFISGLVAIVVVYSLYNIYFDLTSVPDIPGKWKHANKLLFVLIVYGIGTLALKKYTITWMMQVCILFISFLFQHWYL